jgi:diguanylate cyclase (GGDEF)-like protein/PAS domain S-box-containing protein
LLEAARVALEADDFPSAARRLFAIANRLIGSTAGYVALKTEDGGQSIPIFLTTGNFPCRVDTELKPVIRGLRGEVYGSGKPVLENDFANHPFAAMIPPGHVPLQNVLMAPLAIRGDILGILGFGNKPGGFTPQDAEAASAFAEICAIALRHSRHQELLQASEAKFRQLAENVEEVFWISSPDGREITYVSPAYEILWGLSPQSLYDHPQSWADAIHPQDRDRVLEAYHHFTVQQGRPYDVEYRVVRPDDSQIWVHARGFPVVSPQGAVERIVGIAFDITDIKEAQGEVERLRQNLAMILDSAGEGIYGLDLDGRTTFVNPTAAAMLGWQPHELIGNSQHDLTHHTKPDGSPLPGEECRIYRSIHDGQVRQVDDEVFWRKDGVSFPVEYTATPVKDPQGQIVGAMVVFRDVSERRRAQEELRKLSLAVDQAQDWIVITDPHGGITYANQAVSRISGYAAAELLGRSANIFCMGKFGSHFPDEAWESLAQGLPYQGLVANRRKDGEVFHLNMTISPIKDASGKGTHFLCTAKDITQQMQMEAQLHHLANYDALTGLPNRGLFLDRLNQSLARAERSKRFAGVIILNLDRFKLVNESLGPEAGDRVLLEIAGRLQGAVREGDTAARLSGDEFGVALVDLNEPDDAVLVAEKIKESITRVITTESGEVLVTARLGIALYPQDGGSCAELLANAAAALAKAKGLGGNVYQFFTPDLNLKAAEFLSLRQQMFAAIGGREFVLHYQPYFDTSSGDMVGLEALLRWQKPGEGLILPGVFIPVLEETGMIREVGRWVMETACQQARQWLAQGYPVPPVSVNLSPMQFRWPGLADMVAGVIQDCGLAPSHFCLEVTENGLMVDIDYAIRVLNRFREMGCAISIDDFGTGYSSLSYLKKFPLNSLKIDISFIWDITHDPEAAALVMGIISMAHSLGLKTVAEGVETKEQLHLLRLFRCDIIQGFYFSHPLPADELARKFWGNRTTT